MIPKIIHQVWLGKKIPDGYKHLSETLRAYHPEWSYHLWTEDNLAEILDPSEINDINYYMGLSSKSNVIRLLVVNKLGGIYLDCDFLCHNSMDDLLVHKAFIGEQVMKGTMNNAVFGAEKDTAWLRNCIAAANKLKHKPPPWGPHLMTLELTSEVTIMPTNYFYPYWFDEARVGEGKYLTHLWDGEWREEKPINFKISVVIPAYNQEANISRCINSVLAYADETIIVDNNSTDNTKQIILSYPGDRVKYVLADHIQSPYYAVNTGILAAKNEWLLLLDADCSFEKQEFYKLAAARFDTGAVMAELRYKENKKYKYNVVESFNNDCITHGGHRNACVLVRKNVYLKYGMQQEKKNLRSRYDLFYYLPTSIVIMSFVDCYVSYGGYFKLHYKYGLSLYEAEPFKAAWLFHFLRLAISPVLLIAAIAETLSLAPAIKGVKPDSVPKLLGPFNKWLAQTFLNAGFVLSPLYPEDGNVKKKCHTMKTITTVTNHTRDRYLVVNLASQI